MEHKNTEEIRKAEIPQFLFRVAEFMKSRTEWVGTATDLIADMAETETTPNVVTKYLGQFSVPNQADRAKQADQVHTA